MLVDFFTKPLQGTAFRKMRKHILNLPSTNKVSEVHRSVLRRTTKWQDLKKENEGKKDLMTKTGIQIGEEGK